MKKHFLILFSLFFAMTTTTTSFASSLFRSDDNMLHLEGRLGTKWPKAPGDPEWVNELPIAVYKSGSILRLNFHSTLGDIDIAVYDEFHNYVYRSNVNVTAGDVRTINTFGWEDGEYTIEFTDSSGDSLYGLFMVLN